MIVYQVVVSIKHKKITISQHKHLHEAIDMKRLCDQTKLTSSERYQIETIAN